ncbi:MAG: hypothetical protein P4M12_06205 [Gammaproteobacteria bacterium]|nr:hypothetical protein [Gammaproteobacteria bacterium]
MPHTAIHGIFTNLASNLIPGVTIDITTIIASLVFIGCILMFVDYLKDIFFFTDADNRMRAKEREAKRAVEYKKHFYKQGIWATKKMNDSLKDLHMEDSYYDEGGGNDL